ncbi:SDR family oxidoreductase [Blastococcus sp. SYSU DS0539]
MLSKGTFNDRVSIVTGGSSGIGEAIAGELGRLGSTVVLVGRRPDALSVAAEKMQAEGVRVRTYAGDVRDRDRAAEIVSAVVDEFGAVHHLVNSAAGNFQARPEDLSPNGWSAVVRIVLDGTWNFTQLVGQRMITAGTGGSILNIGTTASMIGGPSTVHSTSAKAGVLAMTKSLGAAWAQQGIRVNVLTPGPTADTGAMDHLFNKPGEWEAQVRAIPLKRQATRDEVAHGATYLLSDYAGYITGTNLVIDGGRSLGRDGGVYGE